MVNDINVLAQQIHKTAADHGFWDKERNFGEMLMLIASELAEALEEHRNGMPAVYWKCKMCCMTSNEKPKPYRPHAMPRQGIVGIILSAFGRTYMECHGEFKPEGVAVELIDAIVRCLDTSHSVLKNTNYTVADVMDIKMTYNNSREHMHGKAY